MRLTTMTIFATAWALTAGSVFAGSIKVTTGLDTDLAPASECTLRDAIIAANTDMPSGACKAGHGADKIKLEADETYVLSVFGPDEFDGVTGDLNIVSDIEIDGRGSTIDAAGIDRIFDVFTPASPASARSPISVSFHDLHLTGGAITGARSLGGAIDAFGAVVDVRDVTFSGNSGPRFGGAVFARSFAGLPMVLTIRDCAFENNTALAANGIGGALSFQGVDVPDNVLVVENTTFTNNASSGNGGAVDVASFGAGELEATMRNISVRANSAVQGGGVYLQAIDEESRAVVRISDSTIADNTAVVAGGVLSSGLAVDALIERSTISGNSVTPVPGVMETGVGGGILLSSGSLVLANVTLSGNSASGDPSLLQGGCGGFCNVSSFGEGSLARVVNSTITDNHAAFGGGLGTATLSAGPPARTVIENTVIAGNTALAPFLGPSCFRLNAPHESLGGNLEDGDDGPGPFAGSSTGCDFSAMGDQHVADVLLGPLAANGGPTWTHALLEDSPAIDAADDETCQGEMVGGRDQRGEKRKKNRCDAGAFERTGKDD